MIVEKIVTGPLATNSYLACKDDVCIVIDPADAEPIIRALRRRGIVAVVATHLHFDHAAGVRRVVELFNAPFYAHPADWAVYREINEVALEWGFEIPDIPEPKPIPGRLWVFEVWHTPGHTPGSITLIADGVVFTGDTLFKSSVGRTDLPLGDWDALVQSICRLYTLPNYYVVYPGHGPKTDIGSEASKNPFINISICKSGVPRNPY